MTIKEKEFDCIKFKEELYLNTWKKSGATTLREYVDYVNREAVKSPLHREFVNSAN
ncbi:hypothetical protein NO2_0829 [Candidatus Termititenax persephonae]|uniref:Uncharacterized protein n=1 Tax=Candidatus Termititenax persephonae TaxID=2218525 RepID=A0A388TGN9_9BACT|nr:hypothetical protein NO2_0829 [Candidatus Termititenax persephonae]